MCHAGTWIAICALLLAGCSTPPVRSAAEEQLLPSCVQPSAVATPRLPGPTAMSLTSRSMMPARYPDVARVIGLSPEETIMLFDIIAAQQAQPIQIGPDGSMRMSADEMRAVSARLSERDNCIRALLGKRFPRWGPYNQTLQIRVQVARLRSLLDATRQPISDDRAESLIASIAANQPAVQAAVQVVTPGTGQLDMAANARFLEERKHRMLSAAADWLDTSQLAIFRQMIEEDERTTASLMQRIQPPRPVQPLALPQAP